MMPVLSPLVMAMMYLVSDVVMAVTHEPMFIVLRWLAKLVPILGKIRDFMVKSTGKVGLRDGGKRGPLGLILFSFTVDPVSARGAAAAAGHGFIAGWTLSIIGDMMYFAVLMTATLWLSGIFGDDRITVGATLIVVWGLSWLIRRRQQPSSTSRATVRPASHDRRDSSQRWWPRTPALAGRFRRARLAAASPRWQQRVRRRRFLGARRRAASRVTEWRPRRLSRRDSSQHDVGVGRADPLAGW